MGKKGEEGGAEKVHVLYTSILDLSRKLGRH